MASTSSIGDIATAIYWTLSKQCVIIVSLTTRLFFQYSKRLYGIALNAIQLLLHYFVPRHPLRAVFSVRAMQNCFIQLTDRENTCRAISPAANSNNNEQILSRRRTGGRSPGWAVVRWYWSTSYLNYCFWCGHRSPYAYAHNIRYAMLCYVMLCSCLFHVEPGYNLDGWPVGG